MDIKERCEQLLHDAWLMCRDNREEALDVKKDPQLATLYQVAMDALAELAARKGIDALDWIEELHKKDDD